MSREILAIAGLSFGFAFFLTLFILWVQRMRDAVPRYKRRLPHVRYQQETIESLQTAYRTAGSIEGTFFLVSRKCRQKKARKRFRAAISYLKDSRYQDYETALFTYASDGSRECDEVCSYMIWQEACKSRRLPMQKRSEEENNAET